MKVETDYGEFDLTGYTCMRDGQQQEKPKEGYAHVDFEDGTTGAIPKAHILNWNDLPEKFVFRQCLEIAPAVCGFHSAHCSKHCPRKKQARSNKTAQHNRQQVREIGNLIFELAVRNDTFTTEEAHCKLIANGFHLTKFTSRYHVQKLQKKGKIRAISYGVYGAVE